MNLETLFIEFDPEMGIWSPLVYWYVAVNAILCAAFSVVVVVGGIFDLRYLFRALREEIVDETDDGRVIHRDSDVHIEKHSETQK